MRRVLAAALVILLLAALAPHAQAAINRPKAFHEAFPYMDGLDDPQMTIASGELEASTTRATGSYGFFESNGATISGLARVCYGNSCPSQAGPYSLVVAPAAGGDGGSFAICFPAASGGALDAGHALGLFVDFRNDEDLNSFGVDKSLVAPAVDGRFRFTSIPPVATGGNPTAACTQHGGVTALDDTTRITLLRNGQPVESLTGKSARFAFTGTAQVTDVVAGFYIVPFGDGTARFDQASAGDARAGLDLAKVQDLIAKLDAAHASGPVDRTPAESGGGNTQAILAGLLNGALLRVQGGAQGNDNISLDGARFVRFSSLTVAGGTALSWDGKAYLDIEDGKVKGAKPLLGFWLFKLPWWSYLLWVIAIALAVIRLVTKPDKNHPVWDRFRWIGWVATPVAWILIFFLWDLEVHAVLGASLLRGSSGQFRLIVGLLQVVLLGFIGLAAAAPLRIIGRNTALLAHQGTFMGLAGSVGAILGFLFTAPYLRSYLGLILGKVMEQLG